MTTENITVIIKLTVIFSLMPKIMSRKKENRNKN